MPSFHLVTSQHDWDSALAGLANAHLLQSWAWGDFKSRYGWAPRRLLWLKHGAPAAAAQLLERSIGLRPLRPAILYVPKGPCLDWNDVETVTAVLSDLEAIARRERAALVKIDPDLVVGTGLPGQADEGATVPSPQPHGAIPDGWRPSPDQIQFKNTVWLDLRRSLPDLIASFKQKTRYNIRLAERRGVVVHRPAPDDDRYPLADTLDLLYRLYAETSVRDGFVIRHADYYRDAWGSFIRSGHAQPFIAEVEDRPVAGLVAFHFARRAYYLYGMSSDRHRDKMPNHLLQWAAMCWAKEQGCQEYDFWGAPDSFDETNPMFGVWRFKEGFNGTVVRTIGALDFAPSPLLYKLTVALLPRVLNIMRRRGRARTRQALEA